MPEDFTIAADSSVYYQGRYWNNLYAVHHHLNRLATGDPAERWYTHLLRHNGGVPFAEALILNCGNGWVERDLLNLGVIKSAVGVDISEELLDEARQATAGDAFRYDRMDTNEAQFPTDTFDLVVNHAAGHHIAYPDRVLRALAALLSPNGRFVCWDYVGPHRNQYTAGGWEAAWNLNRTLPERFRMDLRYPHLLTMIASDPTEAIHSELFRPTVERYFAIEHERALGGAIAYLLLTFNDAIHDAIAIGDPDVSAVIDAVLAADDAYTVRHPEDTLFWYAIARPRIEAIDDETLTRWTREEYERERRAAANGGVYYPPTFVAAISDAERQRDPMVRWGDRLPLSARTAFLRLPGVASALRRFRKPPI